MENLYKDIFNQILHYLAIEDIFHLTHTSKWMCEKIKESNLSNQLEAKIFEGSICTICHRKYKKQMLLNRIMIICGRKHAMSAHNDCWKKWKQHNIGF